MSEKLDDAALFEDTIKGSPVSDRIPAPAKRWINRGIVVKRYFSKEEKRIRNVGDFVGGTITYPSKDIAEQKMSEYSKDPNHVVYRGFVEYLGAFPE